jgi:hypothetical protein
VLGEVNALSYLTFFAVVWYSEEQKKRRKKVVNFPILERFIILAGA